MEKAIAGKGEPFRDPMGVDDDWFRMKYGSSAARVAQPTFFENVITEFGTRRPVPSFDSRQSRATAGDDN